MTPSELRAARNALGLTKAQLAALLDTHPEAIGMMERDPSKPTARPPAVRVVRLLKAYLAGYRPDDWPKPERNTP